MEFDKRYKALNAQQREAVDAIDGPVMVVAGPGTGKTELLASRVANILKKTDTLPQNILCLTFTESGAFAMRQRLTSLVGPEAYKVAVHTFHSFGSEVINQNSEYFYNGANFRPADELSSYQVLYELFEKLPHDNPLASTMNGEYVALRQTQSSISHLKKSGLTPDELNEVLKRNADFINWVQPKINEVFSHAVSKKILPTIAKLIESTRTYHEEPYKLITYEPLSRVFTNSLKAAYQTAIDEDSTKPITSWKKQWCEKRSDGEQTLKDEKYVRRLQAVSGIYYDYLVAMQERGMYDFDDMILRTVHALEVFDELRLNLQERYQYILVDEFQDTNDAQMRIIWNLTNNPSQNGRPNIMVVGDDDQAIYRFQGANISNILDFTKMYTNIRRITLKDNYRSVNDILQLARRIIVQADERLENTHPDINKELISNHTSTHMPCITLTGYHDQPSEFSALAKKLKQDMLKNPNESFAIIARKHQHLRELMPFLYAENIPLRYEQRENILDAPPIQTIELLARVIGHIASQELREADALLPELLTHPMWGIPPGDIWKLSVQSQQNNQGWLQNVIENNDTSHINDVLQWLVRMAYYSLYEPLEYVLDMLSGVSDDEKFVSPFKKYYFDQTTLDHDAGSYVNYLSSLTTLRNKLREYQPNDSLKLSDLTQFISMHRNLHISLQHTQVVAQQGTVVELLSAHKAKGLEYDNVYVVGLTDNTWGQSMRSGRNITYPHNLTIGNGNDTNDEKIRLLFVALTRAKNRLELSYHRLNDNGKDLLPVSYLSSEDSIQNEDIADSLRVTETLWHDKLAQQSDVTIRDLLADTLKNYKLSPTHLGSYLDVTRGGPVQFLFQNLLRFPRAMSPSAAFGSAIHETMRSAHRALTAKGEKRPVEDLMGDFERVLQTHQLPIEQYEKMLARGSSVLGTYFAKRYDSFQPSQVSERDFASDNISLGDVRLTGIIDMLDINKTDKTIIVTDYKTGKPVPSWKGRGDYEKIKLHHYKQQLMFYKLLVENSRQFSGFTLKSGVIDFVEPDDRGNLHRLELEFDTNELTEFSRLIDVVWQQILALNFTLDDEYAPSYAGILQFEKDLLKKY